MRKIKISRTFLPEILTPGGANTGGTGLSPATSLSVIPANNVPTIQDVLNGKKYRIPSAQGSWSDGFGQEVETSYKETADDYMRKERDMEIFNKMKEFSPGKDSTEQWKIKIPGGTKSFSSLEGLLRFKRKMKEKGVNSGWGARTSVAQNNVDLVYSSLESTFKIESIDTKNGLLETGGCFCVAKNYFVTCAHVIKKYDKNSQREFDIRDLQENLKISLIKDNRKYNAFLVAIDLPLDIAVISSDINCKPLTIEKSSTIGEEIFAIGSPYGFENNVSFGNISSINKTIYTHDGAPNYMFFDISIFSGNSGGPVFLANSGNVIAMITAIVSEVGEYGLNAGLPSEYIEEFINNYI